MADEQYLAFLLRLRREAHVGPWRATLVNPHTGDQHSFADLDKLIQYLDERLVQLDQHATDKDQGGATHPLVNRL